MEKDDLHVVRTQPLGNRVNREFIQRSGPTGIRGGGGSYFHLLYGCIAGFCIWCIMEEFC